jgi:hypothetical protein
MQTIRWYALACVLVPAVALGAHRLDPGDVPAPLRPWIDWVTFEETDLRCPFLYNDSSAKRCAWPGRLQLDLGPDGGRFSAEWEVFADSWVALPGDLKIWPQEIRLDGHATAIVDRNSKPVLRVGPGKHRIEGAFHWDQVPESLTVPADIGLLRLTVNGLGVAEPDIDRNSMPAGATGGTKRRTNSRSS